MSLLRQALTAARGDATDDEVSDLVRTAFVQVIEGDTPLMITAEPDAGHAERAPAG